MYIYFAQATAGGPIKIGKTIDPSARLSSLQTSSPVELRFLRLIEQVPNGPSERSLHQTFGNIRLNGEWFKPSKELFSYIESLPNITLESLSQKKADAKKLEIEAKAERKRITEEANLVAAQRIRALISSFRKEMQAGYELAKQAGVCNPGYTFDHMYDYLVFRPLRERVKGLLDVNWSYAEWILKMKESEINAAMEKRIQSLLSEARHFENEIRIWRDDEYKYGELLQSLQMTMERGLCFAKEHQASRPSTL